MIEQLGLVRRRVFVAQACEYPLEQGERPAAIEQPLWREIVARFELVSALGSLHIERDRWLETAALQRPRPIALVREEVPDRGAEKGAKSSACRVGIVKVVFLEHAREEFLRQVGGFFRAIPLSADERIHR